MSTNPKAAYRRILLKLSGEALQGEEGFGIDQVQGGAHRDEVGTMSVRSTQKVQEGEETARVAVEGAPFLEADKFGGDGGPLGVFHGHEVS